MNDSITAVPVRAIDHRSIMRNKTPRAPKSVGKTLSATQKPPEQDIKINTDKNMRGALTKLREGLHEFSAGVMRPGTGLVGEKTYETSASRSKENLTKEYIGALTGFHDKVHGFAFGIMRPKTGMIGEKTYDSAHSMTMDNLRTKYVGAAEGLRNILREYAKAAMESIGPPVKIMGPIKIFLHEISDTSAADVPQDTQHVDKSV